MPLNFVSDYKYSRLLAWRIWCCSMYMAVESCLPQGRPYLDTGCLDPNLGRLSPTHHSMFVPSHQRDFVNLLGRFRPLGFCALRAPARIASAGPNDDSGLRVCRTRPHIDDTLRLKSNGMP